jgi:polyphosphate glucokinase
LDGGTIQVNGGGLKLKAFGIDIGGSGIKGAIVDLNRGALDHQRIRIATPSPGTPAAVMDVVAQIVESASWRGPIGCAFPGVVLNGVTRTATNLHKAWIDVNIEELLRDRIGQTARVINDADAAGTAEMRFGAGRPYHDSGVVLMLTFGTGIGSALFTNGVLSPNSELGELELNGHIAETQAAGRLREENVLDWCEWTNRVQRYLTYVENLFWPDLIIFGGGISSESDRFLPNIKTRTRVVPAELRNNAGIVGAALAGVKE